MTRNYQTKTVGEPAIAMKLIKRAISGLLGGFLYKIFWYLYASCQPMVHVIFPFNPPPLNLVDNNDSAIEFSFHTDAFVIKMIRYFLLRSPLPCAKPGSP